MGQVIVFGESVGVMGYALGGALVIEAEGEEVGPAWASLPVDTSVVVLTPAAARALGDGLQAARRDILVVTMPE